MLKINRRHLLTFATALVPGFLLTKMDPAQASSFEEKAKPSRERKIKELPGTWLTKSSAIKIGQTEIFTGSISAGKTVEVVLTRTKNGLIALNGACTHRGCAVAAQGTQLVCPCHGSVFDADTGAVVKGPNGSPKNSIRPLSKYSVTESNGNIYIK